ncbi:MAG: TonB-dependent receptor [Neisseria sp.]|nr:TonB-dependent receptor [Neisseria sp.]
MWAKKMIPLSLFGCCLPVWAEQAVQQEQLETVQVTAKRIAPESLPLPGARKASDIVVSGEKFKSRSATLGNALAGESGVHSNPFGGGASAPVIRGQEGVRVKILQNGSDVVDVSSLSPDHTVAADTLLAQQVELVRGTPTLLYAAASPAGVVNIVDKRIPERMPEKGIEGEATVRLDTVAHEKAATAGITFGIGRNVALRVEGLARQADNYHVPGINLGERLDYVPDTDNRSKVGTIGLSWVGEKGYLGASYSRRGDQYGLPGHNHMLDTCSFHVFDTQKASLQARNYLYPYPHLMDDYDILTSFHNAHCGTEHDSNAPHSHDNVYGHKHDHSGRGPWVDMVSKRLDIRGEWRQPFQGVDKFKFAFARADYHHDEIDDGKAYISPHDPAGMKERKLQDAAKRKGTPAGTFDNQGFNSRLEIYHRPIGGWRGVFGAQYQTQKSRADLPAPPFSDGNSVNGERNISERHPLVSNTNRQFGLFALEQFRYQDFTFEAGARWEKQRIPIDYDSELLARYTGKGRADPDLSTNRQHALSYSGTVLWAVTPENRVSFTASHNERLPTPMELYYHGKHLATNSFEYGNKNLKKERSNNFELGLRHISDKWDMKLSGYYNRFRNFIHNENLYREGNLFMRRYTQSQAKIYGLEGEIGYNITPDHKVTVFGDYVRGKLFDLPPIYGNKIYREYECLDEDGWEDTCYEAVGVETVRRPDRNAPRVPPARLGFRIESQFNENWRGSLEYTRVFKQNKTSDSIYTKDKPKDEQTEGNTLNTFPVNEDKTRGYHLLNAGISYDKSTSWGGYTLSLNGSNLLNQKIYIHNSFLPYVPQPGRNFVFGVNVRF